ncbi:MAG: hypothetical protein KC618_05890 [Candidatus Omnitrophica bacterium]|nr:hypothetical protein [Candidatus Omnitrophota bacterium]
MSTQWVTSNTPLVQGIKAVGVGRKGSRSMDEDLSRKVVEDIRQVDKSSPAVGAFLGALFIKGVSETEQDIFDVLPDQAKEDPSVLVDWLAPDVDETIRKFCRRLITKDTLNKDEAEKLGDFLFSEEPGDVLRGMAASILRVRYETAEEYDGIRLSLEKTFSPAFQDKTPKGIPIVQIAEPFDGVDHSYILTPLLAGYIQSKGYRVVSQCAPSPGPKNIYNLFNIAEALKGTFVVSNQGVVDDNKSAFGYYVNQEQLSPSLARWIQIRRKIVKRPFLSTLERFVNPCRASILIVSAFHPPYGEKMLTIAERAGFKKIIVVRNGLEGGIAFPLKRAAKILCSRKNARGEYERSEFEFWAEKEYNISIPVEEKLNPPVLDENIRLIQEFDQNGTTDNELFDLRVKATRDGITKALSWVTQ